MSEDVKMNTTESSTNTNVASDVTQGTDSTQTTESNELNLENNNNGNSNNNGNESLIGPRDSRVNSLRNAMQSAFSTGVHSTRNALSSLQSRIRNRRTYSFNNNPFGSNTYNPYANDIATSPNTSTISNSNGSVTTNRNNNNKNHSQSKPNNNNKENDKEDICTDSDNDNDNDEDAEDSEDSEDEDDDDDKSEECDEEKQKILDELTCTLCYDLFYEPLTIVCGHTFCRQCLKELLSKCEKKCPLCRTICHINPDLHCVNVTINNLILKIFDKKYKKRKKEYLRAKYPNKYGKKNNKNDKNDKTGGGNKTRRKSTSISTFDHRLPMFVLNSIRLPTQILSLHLFEPRYLHMINRVVSSDRHFGYLCREIGRSPDNNERGYRPYPNDISLFVKVTECEFMADGRCLLEAKCLKRIKVIDAWVERGTQGLWYATYEDYYDSPLSELGLTDENRIKLNEYCDLISKFVDKCYNSSSRHILQQLERNLGQRVHLSKNVSSENYSQWSFFVFGLILAFKDENQQYSVKSMYQCQDFFKRIEACCITLNKK